MADAPEFTVVLRGFDRKEVHALLGKGEAAIASADSAERAGVAEALRRPTFSLRMRGYDRRQVVHHLGTMVDRLVAR